MEESRRLSVRYPICIEIIWLQPWLRYVVVYQGLRARGIVCGHLGDWDIFHGLSLTGGGGLGMRASIAGVGDLAVTVSLEDAWKIRSETPLADVCRIGIETPLWDFGAGTSIGIEIEAFLVGVGGLETGASFAGCWSGTRAFATCHVIGTEGPSSLITVMVVPDTATIMFQT